MQNRQEDRPLVIFLSLAIIGVFSYLIWQRVGASKGTSTEAAVTTVPAAASNPSAPVRSAPGQMRYLNDTTLDTTDSRYSDITLHADAFRLLACPSAAPRPDLRLTGPPPTLGSQPMLPTFTTINGPQAAKENTPRPAIQVTLDGVLNSDTSDAEAMMTVRDPRIVDSEFSERTVMVHVGDRIGRQYIARIGPEGIQFQGATWWPIGQVRTLQRTQTIVQLTMPRATIPRRPTQRAAIADPDRSDDIDPPKLTARRDSAFDTAIDY